MKAIYILWLRQLKRFIRSKERVAASVAQPALYLVALGFGFGPIYAKATNGGNYIQFIAPGIISMSILFTAVFTGIEIIWDKQFGFLKESLVAPVSRTEIMLGRTLGGATVALIQGLIVFIITLVAGFRPELSGILPSLVFMFLVALLFSGLGTAIASILDDMQGFPLIMNFVVMPVYFLSGALFPLKDLPSLLNKIILLNPLAYGVDGIRASLIKSSYFGLGIDFAVLVSVCLVIIVVGGYLFNKIEA